LPPAALTDEWRKSCRRSAGRALRQQAELMRLDRLLAEAAIDAWVLKGGAIAWRGWFDPALRPMRDLDLLVPEDRAGAVQQLLLGRGYVGQDGANTENDKHLPGLTSPETGVVIEIHTHLIEPVGRDGADRDAALRQLAGTRAQALPGMAIQALSDTDTLLHLILHGALDHQFNNGPLLVFDVLAMLEHGSIDWAAYWDVAERAGGTRASQLVFAFVRTLVPELPIAWHGHEPADFTADTMASVAALMLVEGHNRTLFSLPGRIARHGWRDWLGELAKGVRRMAARGSRPPAQHSPAAVDDRSVPASRTALKSAGQSLQIARWLRK
jgi:hypothetical protein